MKKNYLSIAIPSNVLEDCSGLRSKTQKLGQIARAAAIYRVEQIIIYFIDKINQKKKFNDIKLIKGILEYLDCPQYLRRKIFPKLPIFKYVGILPPLRTPHHPLEAKISQLTPKSIREGLVLSSNSQYSEVEIGLENPIKVQIPNLPKNKRIILKLEKRENSVSGILIKKSEINKYWGFRVQFFKESLTEFIKKFSDFLLIATSKKGTPIKLINANLLQKIREKNKILILFGSPHWGLFEIFQNQGLKLGDWVDFIANIAPRQGTQTIRVEEAIISTLAILHSLIHL
ncbi:MAG: putative RNA uridine N3 methyltransferase [Promethearchaeota archaeon]